MSSLMQATPPPAPTTAQPTPTTAGPARSFAFIAPRHADGSDWPWLSNIGPMRQHRFQGIFIENTLQSAPKLTSPYLHWQYLKALWKIRKADLAFFFSTDLNLALTGWPSRLIHQPKRIYIGFTQDGRWPDQKIKMLARAMRQLDAITVFSHQERELYLERFQLDSDRVHVIPIHTDETRGYEQYADQPDNKTESGSYVLSLGSPNRRFTPLAKACAKLKIPLVIITRPWHKNDSLDELAKLGATVITDADKTRSLRYLNHARFAAMCFETDELPGAFTTLIHGMFMGTPSIVTQCLGISEYVIDGETGFVAPHGDDAALEAAIDKLWNQPELADRFGDAAFDRAQRFYSLHAAATAHEALAQRVLAAH